MPKKRTAKRRPSGRPTVPTTRQTRTKASPPHFVGREGSPVLDRYPPKDPSLSVRGPPPPRVNGNAPSSSTLIRDPLPKPSDRPTAPAVPAGTGAPSTPSPAPTGIPLISLERPFDIDEFSQMLGETVIRVEVPREDLAEALRRVSDFMGFGIYVYSFRVRPAPEDLLKRFVIELRRVDYSPEKHDWVDFEEKGRSESPFGPTGGRR